jgi:hypothetical protein
MAGVYRSRHPERTVLYRVLFYHFDRFLTEYERRFEREYGFFRPIVKEVVEILRVFFKYKRGLLGDLCRCALRSLICYFEAVTGSALTPGIIAAIQTFILSWPHTGFKVHSHIFIARVTSHIPDKGQVMVRYYGLYANAHIYRSPETDVRGSEASALQSSWLP